MHNDAVIMYARCPLCRNVSGSSGFVNVNISLSLSHFKRVDVGMVVSGADVSGPCPGTCPGPHLRSGSWSRLASARWWGSASARTRSLGNDPLSSDLITIQYTCGGMNLSLVPFVLHGIGLADPHLLSLISSIRRLGLLNMPSYPEMAPKITTTHASLSYNNATLDHASLC